MERRIIITGESISDLDEALHERYGFKIIPLKVILGDNIYSDGIDIDADMIYKYHDETGILPKTTAVNIDEYIEFFGPLVDEGYTIIHISLSSEFSSSCNNAHIAATEYENVYVVDSRNLSSGAGLLMIAAADMAEKGMPAEEIVKKLNGLTACVDASFVIDSLEYLYKGGRCSSLAMLGANILKLKPCIEVKNGAMSVGKKYRGKYEIVLKEYIKDRLANPDDIDTSRVFITHAGCDESITNDIVAQVKDIGLFDEVFLTRAGSTISSHCGKNTLGILFIRKSPIC